MASSAVSLVLRALLRHPRRTFLLFCNYFICLLVVAFVASLGYSMFQGALEIPDASRLFRITIGTRWGEVDVPFAQFRRIAEQSGTLAALEGITNERVVLHLGEKARLIESQFLVGAPLGSLPYPVLRGRALTETDEGLPTRTSLWNCLISYRLWDQIRQSGLLLNIGDKISIGHTSANIVGILPNGFHGFMHGQYADLYLPLRASSAVDGTPPGEVETSPVAVLAALKPGITPLSAKADVDRIIRQTSSSRTHSSNPFEHSVLRKSPQGITDMVEPYRQSARIFALVCIVVFLISLMDVVWLCSSRILHDAAELGIKKALGSTTYHMVAYIVGEHVATALIALPFSLLAGNLIVTIIVRSLSTVRYPLEIPTAPAGFQIGIVTIACTALIATSVATASSFIPRITTFAMARGLVVESSSIPFRGFIHAMVPLQTATSIILIVASGLISYSFYREITYPIGLSPDRLFLIETDTSKLRTPPTQIAAALSRGLDNLRRDPEILGASMDLYPPLGDAMESDTVTPSGLSDLKKHSKGIRVVRDVVGLAYFNTLHTKFIQGHDFSDQQGSGGERSCVLNSSASTALFGPGTSIGQLVGFADAKRDNPCVVVGVVEDSIATNLKSIGTPMLYTSMLQEKTLPSTVFMLVRARSSKIVQHALAETLAAFAPGMESFQPISVIQEVRDATRTQRTLALLVSMVGILTLVLVSLGLYSSLMLQAQARRRELGIRIALGAPRLSVFAALAKAFFISGAVGVCLGIPISYAVARLLQYSIGVPIAAWLPALLCTVATVGCAYTIASLPPAMAIWKCIPIELIVERRE